MYKERKKYWIMNLDDGYDCAWYTYNIEEWLPYKNDPDYATWVE